MVSEVIKDHLAFHSDLKITPPNQSIIVTFINRKISDFCILNYA